MPQLPGRHNCKASKFILSTLFSIFGGARKRDNAPALSLYNISESICAESFTSPLAMYQYQYHLSHRINIETNQRILFVSLLW